MHGRACDKRLPRLISKIHHTSEFKQYCHVGNTAQTMQTGTVSRTLTLPEILKIQNRPQGEFAYLEVTRFFPHVGCARNKLLFRTVQRNLRLFSLSMQVYVLDLWDLVLEVLHSSSNQPKKSKEHEQGNLLHDTPKKETHQVPKDDPNSVQQS